MNDDPKALNNEGEIDNTLASPPDDEQKTAPEETKPESTEEGKEPEGEKATPKKGAQARIQELNAKAKAAEEKAESLTKRISELTGSFDSQVDITQPPKYTQDDPIVKPGEELTAEELNRRIAERDQKILQRADALAQIRAKQSRILDNINKEADDAIKTYQALNPDSDNFDEELSDAITEATEAYVRSNPTGSVKKFIDKQMRVYQKGASEEVARQSESLAKQASETALRPNNIKPVEKKFEDMSIEEMENKLGITNY